MGDFFREATTPHARKRYEIDDEFVVYVTPRPREGAIGSSRVGAMSDRQPADAGPQRELFAAA